jgi:hypothetical protein
MSGLIPTVLSVPVPSTVSIAGVIALSPVGTTGSAFTSSSDSTFCYFRERFSMRITVASMHTQVSCHNLYEEVTVKNRWTVWCVTLTNKRLCVCRDDW